MKPLIVLLAVFFIGLLIRKLLGKQNLSTAQLARYAMGSMLLFTGISHFVFYNGMAAMLPQWIPFRVTWVYLTGVLEIVGAVGLCTKKYSRITAIGLILLLILVFSANIFAAIHHINPVSGHGTDYLLFRFPLQLFFIWWIYFGALRSRSEASKNQTNPAIHNK